MGCRTLDNDNRPDAGRKIQYLWMQAAYQRLEQRWLPDRMRNLTQVLDSGQDEERRTHIANK